MAEARQLIILFRDEKIADEEFGRQLIQLCQEHGWLVQPNKWTTITPLEEIRAEVVQGSPRPHGVVPFGLKFATT